jgi:hypothetical protein
LQCVAKVFIYIVLDGHCTVHYAAQKCR